MSENGWTKGPWKINRAIDVFHVWSDGGEKDVAVAFHGADDDAEAREAAANARLIAAAPALAEALEACLGLLTGNMDGDLPLDGDPVQMAREALSLAKHGST